MRLLLASLVLSIICTTATSQSFPSFYTRDIVRIPCPFNPLDSVDWVQGWRVYQTLDNTPDGPIDSSRCIDMYPGSYSYAAVSIQLDDVDTTRQLFVETSIPMSLYAESVYGLENNIYRYNFLDNADTCAYGPCSGAYISLQSDNLQNGCSNTFELNSLLGTSMCLSTESAANNTVTRFLFRFRFAGNTAGNAIQLYTPYLSQLYYLDKIPDLQARLAQSGSNTITFPDYNNYGDASLVLYGDTVCPAMTSLYYHELSPTPNTTTVDTINLVIDYYGNLVFQPYTRVRGAHPVGDTINRHLVNIINNGGNFCMNYVVEKTFFNGEYYQHNSGSLSFESRRACLMFGTGGRLIVNNNATLDYGSEGRGIMALRTGGTIELRRNSVLNIRGGITMLENDWDTEPQQIYMDLNEGATMRFLPGSHITNIHSMDGTMKLNIYMKGGVLDLSGLSADERQLINLIYPDPAVDFKDNITIAPNPIGSNIRLSYLCAEPEDLQYELYNLNGDLVASGTWQAGEGLSYHYIAADKLAKGTYIMRLKGAGGSTIKKLLKL